jgi:hypothetical protein
MPLRKIRVYYGCIRNWGNPSLPGVETPVWNRKSVKTD